MKKFTRLQGTPAFKASEGWLFRFKFCTGLTKQQQQHQHSEALDISKEGIWQISPEAQRPDQQELILSQIYSAKEARLFYHSVLTNSLSNDKKMKIPGQKLKKRASAWCCTNASSSHLCNQAAVRQEKQPSSVDGSSACDSV